MSTLAEHREYRAPDNVEQARHRKAVRGVAVYPMAPVREGAPLEEWAAWLEAAQTERDYMATYRETGNGFMHPVVTALSEYRAVAQAVHGRMEYTRLYGRPDAYEEG
ncbi:hypothetical protein AB0E08_07470 [Streptomyces sp. NPDC048281]|uniref:hypothetical protein n=1 Tax=Streptomyces sp. NPDC048281 TaxID=3154715 RepID=UPI003431CB41